MKTNHQMAHDWLYCVEFGLPFPEEVYEWLGQPVHQFKRVVHTVENYRPEPRTIAITLQPFSSFTLIENL